MEINNRKNILQLAYYTMAIFTILMSAVLMIYLATTAQIMYAQIGYFILTGIIELVILYNLITMYNPQTRYYSGLILYIVAVITILMSIILFFTFSTDGIIPTNNLFEYITYVFLSYIASAFSIATFTLGESLEKINHLS